MFSYLESKNIPFISLMIYIGSTIFVLSLSSLQYLELLNYFSPYLPYLITSFLILSYVELNIYAKKFLLLLVIVYIMRLLCYLIDYRTDICIDKNSNCDKHGEFVFNTDGTFDEDYNPDSNLCYDPLFFPAIAFLLVLVFINNKNMIIKTLCIIFMISLYILIFYGNKKRIFKNKSCNEKEKLCYTFFNESLIYAVSLISAFVIMK